MQDGNAGDIITSPEKPYFRLEFLLPPDQLQKRLTVAITIHQKGEVSLGNAWMLDPGEKFFKLIPENSFPGPPKESFLFMVLAHLHVAVNAKFGNLGPVGDLMFPHFNAGIQDLMERRAEKIFSSSRLDPLQKARKIYDLITREDMEAKFLWVKRIHELAFEGGALTLFDAELCEAALYHAQSKSGLGKKYL